VAATVKVTAAPTLTIWSTGWVVMVGWAWAVEQTMIGTRRVMAKKSRVFAFIVYLHEKKFIFKMGNYNFI
jgi:hypothetical protein